VNVRGKTIDWLDSSSLSSCEEAMHPYLLPFFTPRNIPILIIPPLLPSDILILILIYPFFLLISRGGGGLIRIRNLRRWTEFT